ncbi:MAG TPA: hypothetical protein VJB61_21980, partial [Actinomycetota bacterium]
CADGRVLSGLVGSCRGSGTSASAQAGRANRTTGIRARVRVPGTAKADISLGTRRRTASGQASATPRSRSASTDASADTSPRARAHASASRSRRAGRLLDLDATASLAGVGLLGSSPFTLVGDPATDNLLPTGELTLDDLTGETPAGIGVLDTGPIASGNQAAVNVDDVSATVPVTVSCNSGPARRRLVQLRTLHQPQPRLHRHRPQRRHLGNRHRDRGHPRDRHQHRGDHRPAAGDHLAGWDRRRGPRFVDRDLGDPWDPRADPGVGGADGSATSFAPLRPSVAGSGGLPFTGAASDLLALVAFGLLVAGALVVRATRPAAAREGGDDR